MARKDANNRGSTAHYHRLTKSDDGFIDLQFKAPPPKVPVKAICLATVLFIAGSALLVIGALLLSGFIESKHPDQSVVVLILGALMFIPGSYHVWIAYYAWKGVEGYRYEDIPEFE